jgi:hypothetical protein
MDTYEILFNPEEKEGVFAISLVEHPAIEVDFVALSKEVLQLKTIDEDKRILMGAVLIPDKVIPRDGYNIVFSKETIKLSQEYFFKRNNNKNSTIEHDANQFVDGFTIIESWIKEDNEKDKSNLYGYDLPVGTWFAMAKVDNDEAWAKVKSGEVKGFSIDGYFDVKQQLNSINMVTEIVEAIKAGFAQLTSTKEEVKAVELAEDTPTPEMEVEQPADDVKEMVKQMAVEFGKQIEELKAEIEKLKAPKEELKDEEKKEEEPVQMTKAKPETLATQEMPKNLKDRLKFKLKNV